MSNKDRAVQKDNGWRQAMPDVRDRALRLVEYLDSLAKSPQHDADVVRRLVHLLDSREANVRVEERAAWDEYAAAALSVDELAPDEAAVMADKLLAERRQRF